MKKFRLLMMGIALSLAGLAQEKFVEVVVSDSILVEPQQWTMFLSIQKYYDYATTMADTQIVYGNNQTYTPPSSPKEKTGTSIDELRNLVKKNGGKILDDSTGVSYSLFAHEATVTDAERSYLSVLFSSRKSLESFLKAAQKYHDVEGQITSAINPDVQKYQPLLDAKLVNNAKQKAARLASLGGGKLGDLISVTELTESEMTSLKNFLEKMVKMDKYERKSDFMPFITDKITLERSLRIRFAIL